MARTKIDDLPPDLREEARRQLERASKAPTPVDSLVDRPKRKHKYNASPTVWNGIRFDSKGEAAYAAGLDEMVRLGSLAWVLYQVPIRLGVPENRMVVDFMVRDLVMGHGVHFIEFKGRRTPKFERDVKLWRRYGPEQLHIVTRQGLEIIPRGSEVGTR